MDPHFDGVIFKTHAGELRRRLRVPFPPFCVVDVRPREEHERAHIPGSVSATAAGLAGALPPGTTERTEFFVVGGSAEDPEMRAASLALRRLGAHRVVEVTGGIPEWKLAGGSLEGTEGERRAA
jgi:rhodanese-related sulfurtransferase